MSPDEHAHADGVDFDPTPHRPSGRGLAATALAATLGLAVVVALGAVPRWRARASAREDRARAAAVEARVLVARPAREPASAGEVTLPGTIEPVQETLVYPRTSGYLRAFRVDLGDAVTAGQVLAEIDDPELGPALRQAEAAVAQGRAALQQARTQRELARVEAARYGAMVTGGLVSQQESVARRAQADVGEANVAAAQAALASAEANVRRLQEQRAFATVRAPFDGVITSRSVEVGQLVSAGTASGAAMFRVSKTDVVRVMVSVPQMYAAGVRAGAVAAVRLREFPGRSFRGEVTRTAGALDAATRTLRTEVRVPNADHALLAGMYAQLSLALGRATPPLYIPATALTSDADGTRVAVVVDGRVRWRSVEVDGDLGDRVAVSTGLAEGDAVVVTPSDRLVEGMRVRGEPVPARATPRGR